MTCDLKETSGNLDLKVQGIPIATINTISTKQIYTNAPNWVPAPFSLAMDISEMQIIDQAFPDSLEFQEKMEERHSLINDQIIKKSGTSIISSHKTLIYEDEH